MRLGVITVGSLFWSEYHSRTQWRANRLREEEKIKVRLPIRYGRKSQTRSDTYTMVFSRLCFWKSHGLGSAYVFPSRSNIENGVQLITEAEFLWAAECKKSSRQNSISSSWGCVALLLNPDSKIPKQIKNHWTHRISQESNYGNIKHSTREGEIVSENGLLQFPWPRGNDGKKIPFDILIATPTNPTLTGDPPTYPRIREIARAWNQNSREHVEYFWKNRQNGIHTYQDKKIIDHLSQSRKARDS